MPLAIGFSRMCSISQDERSGDLGRRRLGGLHGSLEMLIRHRGELLVAAGLVAG